MAQLDGCFASYKLAISIIHLIKFTKGTHIFAMSLYVIGTFSGPPCSSAIRSRMQWFGTLLSCIAPMKSNIGESRRLLHWHYAVTVGELSKVWLWFSFTESTTQPVTFPSSSRIIFILIPQLQLICLAVLLRMRSSPSFQNLQLPSLLQLIHLKSLYEW